VSGPLGRRLSKLEEIRDRNGVGNEVDRLFEKWGTTSAAVLADFGSLIAFRDWLVARRIAATGHQAGVPIVTPYRQRQFDCAVSAKWEAFFDQVEADQIAATAS